MSKKNRDNVDVVIAATDEFMAEPERVRGFLVDLMGEALRLSMATEWEREDNYALTEVVVSDLSAFIPDDLTPVEVAGIADAYDIPHDRVDTGIYPAPAPGEYLVRDIGSGQTARVLTGEEDPSGELFTLYNTLHGSVSWGEVALIEGAAEALIEGRTDDAADCLARLARLGMELVDNDA